MIHPSTPAASRLLRLLLSALVVAAAISMLPAAAQTAAPDAGRWNPEVLVLVMPSLMTPGAEQISINYTRAVPDAEVRKQVDVMARAGNWQVSAVEVSTRADATPNSRPTTSASFATSGIISSVHGAFYVEPFIVGLRSFDSLDINYINVPDMEFRGLKDFENRFVKITMSRSGNAYRYRVQVKDDGFEKLELPFSTQRVQQAAQGPSAALRIAFIVACALLAALIIFIVASRFSRQDRPAGA